MLSTQTKNLFESMCVLKDIKFELLEILHATYEICNMIEDEETMEYVVEIVDYIEDYI